MILTPIPRNQLQSALDRFMADLRDPFCCAVFRQIRATPADRAVGAEAEQHRVAALSLARGLGMAIHPIDDVRSTAAYRREAARRVVGRLLTDSLDGTGDVGNPVEDGVA